MVMGMATGKHGREVGELGGGGYSVDFNGQGMRPPSPSVSRDGAE